jgi:hypothetical protein
VPIANLIMPYQAMSEIWRTSLRPADPDAVRAPGWLLGSWWFFWLTSNIAANVGARFSWGGETVDDYQVATVAFLVSDALSIPLCLIFPVIISRIQAMQTAHAARLSPSFAPA